MYIINKPSALVEQMQIWARENKATNLFIDHASTYMKLGMEIGIDPVIGYVQYALETNFGRFDKKGILDKSYCNPSGSRLIIDRGKSRSSFSFKRFKSWDEGIEAHLDHLALIAGVDSYPKEETHDPRHMVNLFNTCSRVEDLQNSWSGVKDYAKTVKYNVKKIQNIPLELDGDIKVLKEQIKVLKNRLQEKDTEIVKLNKTIQDLERRNLIISDYSEDCKYEMELIQKELNEYKTVVEKLKVFMNN